jgi:hypothetical protein
MDGFVVGGVVPPTSLAYRTRPFEEECLRHLTGDEWVTLLGPRQHGKTSALVRLRIALSDQGISAAIIDLQGYGGKQDPALRRFLAWLVTQVRQQLGLPIVAPFDGNDVGAALGVACDGAGATVGLLVDEATSLHPEVRQAFYSQLRALHTARRGGYGPPIVERLGLLFSGTFRPETVIDDDNSPFNVSRIVTTDDLTADDASALARDVGGEALAPWADRAFALVGGQPYLLQLLLEAVQPGPDHERDRLFDDTVAKLAAGKYGHLPGLLRRLAREQGAEGLLTRVVGAGDDGLPTSGDGLAQFLEIIGVAVAATGTDGLLRLHIRNVLYDRALRASPRVNTDALLSGSLAGVSQSNPAILSPLEPGALDWIHDVQLRKIIGDSHSAAVTAANGHHNRLTLVGLGSAYEGMLLAFIEQLTTSERDAARCAVTLSNGRQPSGSPDNWTFEALVKVAHATGKLFRVREDVSQMIRDWRNLVHPDKARGPDYQEESDMAPEVAVVAAFVTKVLQSVASTRPSP